ncbi:MAG TPA: chlorite dismutase family protein, partial [Nitrospiraceae bacterium]
MMTTIARGTALCMTAVWLAMPGAAGAADREKLLSEPGVYGTFVAFGFDEEWAKEDQPTRIAHLTVLKGVVEQHREKLAIDLYLLRGLSDHADLLFRVHATELRDTQKFLVDLQASPFGKHLQTTVVLHGLTKKANYVPGFPDNLKTELKAPSESGP